MIERRNFYRVLHVQPDASMAVIRENYRVLMQKLKLHPDLGGGDWNASLLNAAYATLKDPLKRAAYDRELLERYRIKTLSQGAFSTNTGDDIAGRQTKRSNLNQRNYYRILQVQSDSPITVIAASYRALKKNSPQDIGLLDEAYRVLSNPTARKQYDALLFARNSSHAAEESVQTKTQLTEFAPGVKNISPSAVEPYQAVITHYCSFCKTPYVPQMGVYHTESCLECASPLFVLQHENLAASHRTMMRTIIRGELMFYLFWPSRPWQGLFQDLSPTGIRFLTEYPVDLHDIIKIDAPNFQAVAEVTHTRNEGHRISAGTRFIAVKFDQRHGNFITVQA